MKRLIRWHVAGSAVWSAIFVAVVAFGAQLVAYVWIQHWQQGFSAITTLMLLTSVVIGALVAALESPAKPQGHGLAAATRMKRPGSTACPRERATASRPSSNGCRSDSSASRRWSAISSMNNTPRRPGVPPYYSI
jgi:hypothetical protein